MLALAQAGAGGECKQTSDNNLVNDRRGVEFALALGAVGLPFGGKGIGLNASDVLQVDLHSIDGSSALDPDTM